MEITPSEIVADLDTVALNYDVTKEPRGSKGPTKRNLFDAGRPFQ